MSFLRDLRLKLKKDKPTETPFQVLTGYHEYFTKKSAAVLIKVTAQKTQAATTKKYDKQDLTNNIAIAIKACLDTKTEEPGKVSFEALQALKTTLDQYALERKKLRTKYESKKSPTEKKFDKLREYVDSLVAAQNKLKEDVFQRYANKGGNAKK